MSSRFQQFKNTEICRSLISFGYTDAQLLRALHPQISDREFASVHQQTLFDSTKSKQPPSALFNRLGTALIIYDSFRHRYSSTVYTPNQLDKMPGQGNPWTLEERFANHLLQRYHNLQEHAQGISSEQIARVFNKTFPARPDRTYSNLRDDWTQRNNPQRSMMYRTQIDIDPRTYSAAQAGYYNWAKGWSEHFMNTDHPGVVSIPALPVPPGPGTAPPNLLAPPLPAAAPPAPAPPAVVPPAPGVLNNPNDDSDDEYNQAAAINAALQYEGGEVLNEHFTRTQYMHRRAGHLSRLGGNLAKYATANATYDARTLTFPPGEDDLSVQEIRRRELREKFEYLTPLATKGNTDTINNYAGYGNQEWTPGKR